MIKFELMKHQSESLQRANKASEYFWFHDMGTGKTCTSIQWLRKKYAKHGKILKTLIITPLSMVNGWPLEIEKFSKIPKQAVKAINKDGKARVKLINEAIYNKMTEKNDKELIVIINYDAFQSDSIIELFESWGPDVILYDEAHTLKNYKSIRAKNIYKISKQARYKAMLSGTPIPNSPLDVFMPFKILDNGETFGTNFFTFRATYFIDHNASWASRAGYFPKWQINPDKFQELNEKIYNKADRVLKADCLDLPPFVRVQREVSMSKEQTKAYNEMKRELITYIDTNKNESKAVVANIALTKALRLQQIVCGCVTAEDGSVIEFKDNPRIDELKELLKELTPNHKVIVWSVFSVNYKQIAKAFESLGLKYVFLNGEQDANEKQEAINAFNNDPSIRGIIANQKAGGAGVNLIASSYSIYYSKNFSNQDNEQSEARNYRQGSQVHDKVTRIDLVCHGSIDETLNACLLEKKNLAEKILDTTIYNGI